MQYGTLNELVEAIAARASILANMPLNDLRESYPASTRSRSEAIRYCRDMCLSRGDLVYAILVEEFQLRFSNPLILGAL